MSTGHSSGDFQAQPPQPPAPPPLPTEPHPHHYVARPACVGFGQQTWTYDGLSVHHNTDIPHISSLLLREAEAWRAVLGLHAATVGAAQHLARSTEALAEQSLLSEERALNSESRESAYCCALSGLARECDNLHNECLKLRTLRKSRRIVEVQCLAEVVRSSSDEIMAIGQTLASNGALNLSSATSDLRVAIQNQRNQVSQLRALLDAVRAASVLPLPRESKLVLGIQKEGGAHEFHGVDEVLRLVYEHSRDLNETSLSEVLKRLFVSESQTKSPVHQNRQFARRAADREVAGPRTEAENASATCAN